MVQPEHLISTAHRSARAASAVAAGTALVASEPTRFERGVVPLECGSPAAVRPSVVGVGVGVGVGGALGDDAGGEPRPCSSAIGWPRCRTLVPVDERPREAAIAAAATAPNPLPRCCLGGPLALRQGWPRWRESLVTGRIPQHPGAVVWADPHLNRPKPVPLPTEECTVELQRQVVGW